MLEHFADFAARESLPVQWYQDPSWLDNQQHPASISTASIAQAKAALLAMLDDETTLHRWFGQFITEPQGHQGSLLTTPPERTLPLDRFKRRIHQGEGLSSDLMSRWAQDTQTTPRLLHINGETTSIDDAVDAALLDRLCTQFDHPNDVILPYLTNAANLDLLHGLWQAGIVHWLETE
jgi:ribosomal protein L16 Arg81 hydroxylase